MRIMSNNRYAVYARRQDEKNWSDWCRESELEIAMNRCEKIRKLGYKAKIYNIESKEIILQDD